MAQCHGGGFPDPIFGLTVQGQCGSAEVHDEHEFDEADKICAGSALAFTEGERGNVGPHGEHPINTPPTMLD